MTRILFVILLSLMLVGCIPNYNKFGRYEDIPIGTSTENTCEKQLLIALPNRAMPLCRYDFQDKYFYSEEYKTEILTNDNKTYFVFENVNKKTNCTFLAGCFFGDGKLKLVTQDREKAKAAADPKLWVEFLKKEHNEETARKQNIVKLYEKQYGSKCSDYKNNLDSYSTCLYKMRSDALEAEQITAREKAAVERLENSDIAKTCLNFGYKKGTEKYADCMKDLYIQQQNANNSGTTNVIVNDSGSQAIADELKKQNNLQQSEYLLRLSDRLLNPPKAPAVNCSSYAIGGTVQTRCQ